MKKVYILRFAIFSFVFINNAAAQNPSLISDINTMPVIPYPDYYGRLNTGTGLLLFNATDNRGLGLWRSDGTAEGTYLLTTATTIAAADASVEYNGAVFFKAYDGNLWKTDGTPSGTVLVKTFSPVNIGSPYRSAVLNGFLYFSAAAEQYVNTLWKTDGTTEGTVKVSDIAPSELTLFNDHIIFEGYSPTTGYELYISDGTESGTVLLKDIYTGTNSSFPHELVEFNGVIYFFATESGYTSALWKTDGTISGTQLIKVFAPIQSFYGGLQMTVVNGKLLIYAFADGLGDELWISDGTTDGTQLLYDINAGAYGSTVQAYPDDFFVEDNVAYFPATTSLEDDEYELWRSDGTITGTYPVKKDMNPKNFAALPDGKFVFTINSYNTYKIWVSDGIESGTQLIDNEFFDNQDLLSLISFSDKVFFVARASAGLSNTKLCSTDGTLPGTNAFPFDITENGSSKPAQLVKLGDNKYILTANDGIHGKELFATNGIAGSTLLQDVMTGTTSSYYNFCPFSVNGIAYFNSLDSVGYKLWKTDGTVQGTFPVKALNPEFDLKCALLNDELYFVNLDVNSSGFASQELWKTDGTESGTIRIKDINPSGSDNVSLPVALNNKIYFVASDGASGTEFWKTNGTSEGTGMVKDINPGSGSSYPYGLTVFNGRVLFGVNTGPNAGLWSSDGTPTGTILLNASVPGTFQPPFAVSGNYLYYDGEDSAHGAELWKTDGTIAGTQIVKDIKSGPQDSGPIMFTDVNGTLFFLINTYQSIQLWKSDGTDEGTLKVITFSNDQFLDAIELTNVDGVLYFVMENYAVGSEVLWRSDGTACHTQQLDFYAGGDDKTDILLADSNTLFLSLNSELLGSELWSYEGSPIPTIEVCNGFDDDCDGLIDEDGVSVSISTNDPTILCQGDPITLTAAGSNIVSYQWYKNGTAVVGATNSIFTAFFGTDYYVVAYGNGDCIGTSNTITVQRKARPQAMITVLNNGNLDLCLGAVELQSNSGNDLTWQWLLNGEPIAGATNQNYIPAVPGNYRVKVFKSNGCGSSSKKVMVTSSCRNESVFADESTLVIYPNPASEFITVNLHLSELISCKSTIIITDVLGRTVLKEDVAILNGTINHLIPLYQSIANGVYMLHLVCTDYSFQKQFVVQR